MTRMQLNWVGWFKALFLLQVVLPRFVASQTVLSCFETTNTQYLVFDEPVDVNAVQQICSTYHGHLAEVSSTEVMTFISTAYEPIENTRKTDYLVGLKSQKKTLGPRKQAQDCILFDIKQKIVYDAECESDAFICERSCEEEAFQSTVPTSTPTSAPSPISVTSAPVPTLITSSPTVARAAADVRGNQMVIISVVVISIIVALALVAIMFTSFNRRDRTTRRKTKEPVPETMIRDLEAKEAILKERTTAQGAGVGGAARASFEEMDLTQMNLVTFGPVTTKEEQRSLGRKQQNNYQGRTDQSSLGRRPYSESLTSHSSREYGQILARRSIERNRSLERQSDRKSQHYLQEEDTSPEKRKSQRSLRDSNANSAKHKSKGSKRARPSKRYMKKVEEHEEETGSQVSIFRPSKEYMDKSQKRHGAQPKRKSGIEEVNMYQELTVAEVVQGSTGVSPEGPKRRSTRSLAPSEAGSDVSKLQPTLSPVNRNKMKPRWKAKPALRYLKKLKGDKASSIASIFRPSHAYLEKAMKKNGVQKPVSEFTNLTTDIDEKI